MISTFANVTVPQHAGKPDFLPICVSPSFRYIIVDGLDGSNTFITTHCTIPLFVTLPSPTIHPNYRQAVFSITLNFPLEFTQDGLPELGSSFKEIFLVALFEKNPKLIIFHFILHPDSRGLLENLFR